MLSFGLMVEMSENFKLLLNPIGDLSSSSRNTRQSLGWSSLCCLVGAIAAVSGAGSVLGTGSVWSALSLCHTPDVGQELAEGRPPKPRALPLWVLQQAAPSKGEEKKVITIKKSSQGKFIFQIKRNHSEETSPGKYLYIR